MKEKLSVTFVKGKFTWLIGKLIYLDFCVCKICSFIPQVMLTEKNPYIWDPASDSLTTPMVSLTLRDDLHQNLNVSGLANPVDVYISNSSM